MRAHPALVVAGITTGTFILKVWLAAAADPTVALGIVAASGGVQLATSLLTLFFPAVVWSLVVWLVYLTARPRALGAGRLYLYIGTWVAAAWALFISPLAWLGIVAIGVLVVPGFFWLVEWLLLALDGGPDTGRHRFVSLIPLGGAFAWSIFLFLPGMWLPTENYTLRDGGTEVGYFIEEEGPWLTVLRDHDRHLIRLSADDIEGREVCSYVGPRNLMNTPIYQLFFRADTLPECRIPAGSDGEESGSATAQSDKPPVSASP